MRLLAPLLDRLRLSRVGLALLLGVVAFLLVVAPAAILFLFNGMFVADGGVSETEVPYASFDFEETNVTVTDHNATEPRIAVVISHRSGFDLPQESVEVTVNGREAWDVRETDDGYNASAAPWNASSARISDSDARVVVYGDALGEEDLERSVEHAERYTYLEAGDVIEITWYDDDGEQMTVLQRYVVGKE